MLVQRRLFVLCRGWRAGLAVVMCMPGRKNGQNELAGLGPCTSLIGCKTLLFVIVSSIAAVEKKRGAVVVSKSECR